MKTNRHTQALTKRQLKEPPGKWRPHHGFPAHFSDDDVSEISRLFNLTDPQSVAPLMEQCQVITQRYQQNVINQTRPTREWYDDVLNDIKDTAEYLKSLLGSLNGVPGSILNTEISKFNKSDDHGGVKRLIENNLSLLIKGCEASFKRNPFIESGTKVGCPLEIANSMLASDILHIWNHNSSSKFKMNFSVIYDQKGKAVDYTSPGPKFAYIIFRKVDKYITIDAVTKLMRTAARNMSKPDDAE